MLKKVWSSRWTPVVVAGVIAVGAFLTYSRERKHVEHDRTTYRLPTDLLVRGNPDLMEVALTFDDGPKRETAEPILDVLMARGIRATFFVVGRFAEENPDLIRRMMAEGHEVGNHTMTHPRLTTLDEKGVRHELESCEMAVREATGGVGMHLFRPPGMQYTEPILRTIQDMGYVTVHWNVVAGDYEPVAPDIVTERVLRQAVPGSVILLHLSPDTAKALPEMLDSLSERGYRFVTVSQMLARLPRPVFCASNAYAVLPDAVEGEPERPVATKAPTDRRRVPSSRSIETAEPVLPVDVPVGGGTAPGPVDTSEDMLLLTG